jgi:hypothetical protein
MLGQQIAVEGEVLVIEKRARAAIAALGDVVGDAGDDNTSKTGHAASSHQLGRESIKCTVTVICNLCAHWHTHDLFDELREGACFHGRSSPGWEHSPKINSRQCPILERNFHRAIRDFGPEHPFRGDC